MDLDREDWGKVLEFAEKPEACAGDIVTPVGPFGRSDIEEVEGYSEGSEGGDSWLLFGQLADGRWFYINAGCSWTGWDFGSGECLVSNERRRLVRFGMGDEARERLSIVLPISHKVRISAGELGISPQELDRTLREQQSRVMRTLQHEAERFAGDNLGRGYWTMQGSDSVLCNVLDKASKAPMPDGAEESIAAEIGRNPTGEILRVFLDLYRIQLFNNAPRGERSKCLCGHWQWGVHLDECMVCGATLCYYCAKSPVPTERRITTCPGCVDHIPGSWRELVVNG